MTDVISSGSCPPPGSASDPGQNRQDAARRVLRQSSVFAPFPLRPVPAGTGQEDPNQAAAVGPEDRVQAPGESVDRRIDFVTLISTNILLFFKVQILCCFIMYTYTFT